MRQSNQIGCLLDSKATGTGLARVASCFAKATAAYIKCTGIVIKRYAAPKRSATT